VTAFGAVGAAVLLAAVGAAVPVAPPLGRTPPAAVSWLNAGDSFSAGEGLTDARGLCARAPLAYGERAVDILTGRGWSVSTHEFVACAGSTLREFYGHGDQANQGHGPQWTQATRSPGRDRFDVITMSFGAVDIGFGDIVKQCLVYPIQPHWRPDRIATGPRCALAYEQITDAIDSFVGLTTPTAGEAPQLLADFYAQVAREGLTERGHLVVVGYPAIFAPSSEWADYRGGECASVTATGADMHGAVAAYLEKALRLAVEGANRSLGENRISYVSRRNLFHTHELCGTGETWLVGFQGLTVDNRRRYRESFQVNEAGHLATAQAVADQVAIAFGEATGGGELARTPTPSTRS
jgi:hypothetical protein